VPENSLINETQFTDPLALGDTGGRELVRPNPIEVAEEADEVVADTLPGSCPL